MKPRVTVIGAPRSTAPAPALKPTVLPGVQRAPVQVALADLARRFPQADADTLQRAQAQLSGIHVPGIDAAGWMSFGIAAQEALGHLVRERLAQSQDATIRGIPQHLRRLQELLGDVLDAFERGFFRKPAPAVWFEHEAEVRQLEALLGSAPPALSGVLQETARLKAAAHACAQRLEATALAGEFLLDQVGPPTASLLVARLTSLTGSQALLREHLLHLDLDASRIQELIALVQDGVLLKLPAVHAQLAGLAARPSETQRFVAVEKLTDILQTLKRAP